MKQNTVVRRLKSVLLSAAAMGSLRFRLALLAMLVCLAVPTLISAADDADSTAIGTLTVEGLVRDIACPLQNILKNLLKFWSALKGFHKTP